MPFAQGDRTQFAFVAETVFGTTPVTPTMLLSRITGHKLALKKDTFVSEEIRSDRQITDARHGVRGVSGNIDFELIYGVFDSFLEAALMGTWATNVLKAGTVVRSFTLEEGFMDFATPFYNVYTGCVVNELSLDIKPNAMVTGSFGILGKNATNGTVALGSPSAINAFLPFDGFSGVISEGGSAVAHISAIELKLENGFDPAMVVGANTTPQFITGKSNLTGTITVHTEDLSLLNKFLNETESSLTIALDGTAGDLTISIPRIKYTGGEIPLAKGARMITLPFQALRDSGQASNIVITRTP